MKRRLVSTAACGRPRLALWGLGASLLSGGYFLFPGLVGSAAGSIGRNIINPTFEYVSGLLAPGLDQVRSGFVNLGAVWDQWTSSLSRDMRIEWREGEDFFTVVWEGNKKLLVSAKNILLELSRFMFVHLPEFIGRNGLRKSIDYLRHYLRPLKLLFSRPELDRLQSSKTRFDQFVNAFKNPDFPATLKSMNGFYVKFKGQIDQLDDSQLAELIDIYLENPAEMGAKVDLILKNMEGREEELEKSFDVELMMDFVRGENIDRIRAKLAASKVSSELAKITSIFNWGDAKYDKSNLSGGTKNLDESIEGLFVSTVA